MVGFLWWLIENRVRDFIPPTGGLFICYTVVFQKRCQNGSVPPCVASGVDFLVQRGGLTEWCIFLLHFFFFVNLINMLQRAEMSCTSARWSWTTRKWASAPKRRRHCGRENWQPQAEWQSCKTRRRCIMHSAKVRSVCVCVFICTQFFILQHMWSLKSSCTGVPKNRRGEVWLLLSHQHRLRHRLPQRQHAPDTPYHDLLKQLTAQQHAILVDLGLHTVAHKSWNLTPLYFKDVKVCQDDAGGGGQPLNKSCNNNEKYRKSSLMHGLPCWALSQCEHLVNIHTHKCPCLPAQAGPSPPTSTSQPSWVQGSCPSTTY